MGVGRRQVDGDSDGRGGRSGWVAAFGLSIHQVDDFVFPRNDGSFMALFEMTLEGLALILIPMHQEVLPNLASTSICPP